MQYTMEQLKNLISESDRYGRYDDMVKYQTLLSQLQNKNGVNV